MKIYLVGFMGSGKTTCGKILAGKLNFSFLDLDKEIERRSGASINDLFLKGEPAFRNLEQAALHETSTLKDHIIATGGGTPCFYNNMEWMNKNGVTVYLKLSPVDLTKRLKDEKHTRPLVKNLSEDDLQNYIQKTLHDREWFYNQAAIIINPISS